MMIVASAFSWGALVAGVTVVVGLATAVMNHQTARLARRVGSVSPPVPDSGLSLLPSRTHFVNRTDEIRDAITSIDAGEVLVAIEGEVGVGKSAVATELVHRLRNGGTAGSSKAFQDRTFLWVDGRNGPVAVTDICRSLATLTGNQLLSVAAEEEKLDVLRTHMATNRTVLVLDNLRLSEDVESVAVRDFVNMIPSGSLVIATLSTPGMLNGVRVPLAELKPGDARDLIRHEVKLLGLTDGELISDAFAARLIGVVGGNPGLISWFLRGLSRSPRSIEESFAALERGEGLHELLSPIWEGLSPAAQRSLGVCAHLDGRVNVRQLAIALELSDAETHEAVEELLSVGLLKTVRVSGGPNAFNCSHAVQVFTLSQAPREDLAIVTERLARRYCEYFSEHWEDARAIIPHVDAVRAVLKALLATGDDETLQRLVKATLDVLFTLGLFDDRITWGEISYRSAELAENDRAASLACSILSSTHAIRGELQAAEEAVALGLLAAERSRLPNEVARQQRDRGFVRYRSGDAEGAIASVDGVDGLARAAGDLNNLVDIIDLRMSASLYIGAFEDAEAAAHEQLSVCAEIPWERPRSNGMRHLAEIAIHRGSFAEARDLLTRAREIAVSFEDRRGLARIELTDARRLLMEGRVRQARAAAGEAVRSSGRIGLPPETREAHALRRAAGWASLLPPLRVYYRRRRPWRLTTAPVAGD